MAKKRREVGKGIRALLANIENETEKTPESVVKELAGSVAKIPLSQISVNPYQPRTEFVEEALEALSQSIKVHGLIQPITLRRLGKDEYQLISGERRFRASKRAGLEEVPAYVRLVNDQEMIEMALVENIQREDLNAIEVAITYQRLIEECRLTHESLSKRVGKSRANVTNHLRLLKLPPEIVQAVRKRKISMGHARALVGLDDFAFQLGLFRRIVGEELSVRKTEQIIKEYLERAKKKPAAKKPSLPAEYRDVQDRISRHFSSKAALKLGKDGKGQIIIHFDNDEDLNRLLDIMEGE